jgi:hypothetical protein
MSTCSLSLSDKLTILAWSFERFAVILISRFVAQPSDTSRHESVSFLREVAARLDLRVVVEAGAGIGGKWNDDILVLVSHFSGSTRLEI